MRISTLRIPVAAALAAALVTAGAALAAAQPAAEKPRAGQGQGGPVERGVLVAGVVPDSPAAKAGVARGDIILSAGGSDVNTPADLVAAVRAKKPGDTLSVSLTHGDAARTVSVTLAEENGRAVLGVFPFGPGRGDWEGGPMMGGRDFDDRGFGGPGGSMMRGGRGFGGPGPGAWVQTVTAGGPAEKAGLKAGDVILAVDGTKVGPEGDLSALIAAHKPGDAVTLSVGTRGAAPRDVKVTLGESSARAGGPFLGVEYSAAPRGPAQGERPFPGVRAGVVVRQVAEAGPAAKAGVKSGDVIVAVEGVPVSSPRAVAGAVASRKPGDSLSLTVQRQGEDKESTLAVTLGEDPAKPGRAFLGLGMGRVMSWESAEDVPAGPGARWQPGGPGERELPGEPAPAPGI
jgi:S1-C subfamily serine protease